MRQKQKDLKIYVKKTRKEIRYLGNIYFIGPVPKIKLNKKNDEHKGGQASPVIKEEKIINSKIEIFGVDNVNEETVAHEVMHTIRLFKVYKGNLKIYRKHFSRLYRKSGPLFIISAMLSSSIQEASAEFFEIIYRRTMVLDKHNIKQDMVQYLNRLINDNNNLTETINKCIDELIKILNTNYTAEQITSEDIIGNISKRLFDYDYTLNWIFGIFIAYMILKINDNDITRTLRTFMLKNDLVIVKLISQHKDYLNDIRNVQYNTGN